MPISPSDVGIGVFDGVLTYEECQELIAIHEAHRHAGYIHHLTITRFADLARTRESLPWALPFLRARFLCWERVEEYFNKRLELFPEFTALMAWHKGSFLQTHYDANRDYLQDRHYSAILYLNDPENCNDVTAKEGIGNDGFAINNCISYGHPSKRFLGGDLVFEFTNKKPISPSLIVIDESQSLRISPKSGRLVCFPSTAEYMHRVCEITKGTRYTLTLWFTLNEDAMETLESVQWQLSLLESMQQKQRCDLQSLPPCLEPSNRQQLLPNDQPWETPEQAKALINETMAHAKLAWQYDARCWYNSSCNHSSEAHKRQKQHQLRLLSSLSHTEVLQLVAFCWWKRRMPLGILLAKELASSDTNNGGPDSTFDSLVHEWRNYSQCRLQGIWTAYHQRWKHYGLITNVADNEIQFNYEK
jgi:hypothetical protein